MSENENYMSKSAIWGTKMAKTYYLERFLDAQNYKGTYERALQEIKNGSKETHWIWFVFPQCYGLGYSEQSRRYGIKGSCEAKAYIENEILRERLLEICEALSSLNSTDSTDKYYDYKQMIHSILNLRHIVLLKFPVKLG